jgi:hypothetical protein
MTVPSEGLPIQAIAQTDDLADIGFLMLTVLN